MELIYIVNTKNAKRWSEFYDRFYPALCAYVSHLLQDTNLAAQDIVQEVFISIWEGERTFTDIKELSNYLYRACYNRTLVYLRNEQTHDAILSRLAEEALQQDQDWAYAESVREEIVRQLYRYIHELPPEQQRILLLRIEGLQWEEIAEKLGVSINTVKTQKSRSYRFLREKMGIFRSLLFLLLFLLCLCRSSSV